MTTTPHYGGESQTSFAGVSFRILWSGDDTSLPGWTRASIIVESHIPGTDDTEIDLLGFGPWKQSYNVECANKYALRDLRRLVQTEGVLYVPAAMNDMVESDVLEVVFGRDVYAKIPDVLLTSLTDERVQVDGKCFATLSFSKESPDDV